MIYSKKAFTFVELIIVVGVISLLGIIGVTQYVDYASKIRDASRLTQVTQLHNGIEAFMLNNSIDLPGNKIDLEIDGRIIGYQGDIDNSILDTIDFSSQGVDPKTQEYYSILIDKNKKHFQILGFLENFNEFDNNQEDYVGNTSGINKNIILKGDYLGIMTDTYGVPIQRINFLNGGLDIGNTTNEYVSFFSQRHVNSGSDELHSVLETVLKQGGLYEDSCNNILGNNYSLEGRDGKYVIGNQVGQILTVYCNMSFQGGGWTLFYANNGLSTSPIKESYTTMRDNVIDNQNIYDLSDYESENLAGLIDYRFIGTKDSVELLAINKNEFSNGLWAKTIFSTNEVFTWALSDNILGSSVESDQCIDIINNGEVSYYLSNGNEYENIKQISNHYGNNIGISHSNNPCNGYTSSVLPHLLFYVSNNSGDDRRTRSNQGVGGGWGVDNQYRYFMR